MRFSGTRTLLLSLCAVLVAATAAFADGVADKVTINDPYVRAVPPVVKTTAAFMQIQNTDAVERFIVGASSPIASDVELHMHEHDGGVMRMRRIPHIHLPPDRTVALEPGGLHVMMFGLRSALHPGEEVPVTLTFDDGSTKTVTAIVRSVEGMMMHH
ncbi:MAG: copper chaperone PCu(A)C [Gammaproteobacteria bacterium]|nr:copper chaperone PCu(A)C [Gammaproteobacteria bacterium]MCP5299543.1 copper chaperone PCu(A)C [Chromatiaceae bacterium]